MKIIVKDGLLWEKNTNTKSNIISCPIGDRIAEANGFVYVERIIKKYVDGSIFEIDKNLKIKDEK